MTREIILAVFLFLNIASPALAASAPIAAGTTLALKECIDIALSNDPDIKSLIRTARAQHYAARQQVSAYLPSIAVSAAYLSNHAVKQTVSDPAATSFVTYDGKSAGAALNQLIFDFGKTPANIAAANASTLAARYNTDNEAVSVVSEVKQAYHALVYAKLVLKLSDETVDQYRRNLSYAKAHFQANIRPKYDVTKAEADLSSAKLDRIKAANNVQLAKAYLDNAMNQPNAPDYGVQENTIFVPYPAELDKVVSVAYDNNPSLLSYLAQVHALEAQLRVARRDLYPALNASGGYNFGGSVSPISQGWNAGLNLSADIFTGLRKSSKISEQEHRLAALRFTVESVKLQIFLSAKQAFLNLNEAAQAKDTATDQVKQATENLEIANLRYKTGLGSPVEISDATVMYNTAKTSFLRSLYDYKTAQANLEKVMGSKQ